MLRKGILKFRVKLTVMPKVVVESKSLDDLAADVDWPVEHCGMAASTRARLFCNEFKRLPPERIFARARN